MEHGPPTVEEQIAAALQALLAEVREIRLLLNLLLDILEQDPLSAPARAVSAGQGRAIQLSAKLGRMWTEE